MSSKATTGSAEGAEKIRARRKAEWAVRSCTVVALLVFVVLPLSGVAFAAWLYGSSLAPEAAAAAAYRSAPACGATAEDSTCVREAYATLLSLDEFPGRWGSHTDRLHLRLPDGVHEAEIAYDILAPRVVYETASGVRVREYRGLVTAVFTVDGRAFETTDSPTGGASVKGVALVIAALLSPWLLLLTFVAIRHPGGVRDIGRLLRNGRLVDPAEPATATT